MPEGGVLIRSSDEEGADQNPLSKPQCAGNVMNNLSTNTYDLKVAQLVRHNAPTPFSIRHQRVRERGKGKGVQFQKYVSI